MALVEDTTLRGVSVKTYEIVGVWQRKLLYNWFILVTARHSCNTFRWPEAGISVCVHSQGRVSEVCTVGRRARNLLSLSRLSLFRVRTQGVSSNVAGPVRDKRVAPRHLFRYTRSVPACGEP